MNVEIRQGQLPDGRWRSAIVVDGEEMDYALGYSRLGTLETLAAIAESNFDITKAVFALARASAMEEVGRAQEASTAQDRPLPSWGMKEDN